MAYIYRGIIYWMDGEPDNARACFRSAEFEDSDAEKHQYAGDWVLPDYLDGLITTKLGGDGSDAFKRAQADAEGVKLPPYNLKANVLFFIEFGPGPTKYRDRPVQGGASLPHGAFAGDLGGAEGGFIADSHRADG